MCNLNGLSALSLAAEGEEEEIDRHLWRLFVLCRARLLQPLCSTFVAIIRGELD